MNSRLPDTPPSPTSNIMKVSGLQATGNPPGLPQPNISGKSRLLNLMDAGENGTGNNLARQFDGMRISADPFGHYFPGTMDRGSIFSEPLFDSTWKTSNSYSIKPSDTQNQYMTPVSNVEEDEDVTSFSVSEYFQKHVLCISNIPWDITSNDVRSWLNKWKIAEFGVHILMDRSLENAGKSTGKTFSDAYVEFDTSDNAKEVLFNMNRTNLKGRVVSVRMSSQEELMRRLFPNWTVLSPSFARSNSHRIPSQSGVYQCKLNDSTQNDHNKLDDYKLYLKRGEIQAILMVCKNYKLHFSRKCADRPFENVISVVSKIPWGYKAVCPTVLHRDHIFELLKLSIEILWSHLSKNYYHVSDGLIDEMIRVGIKCPGFTERQKTVLLQVAKKDCPEDLMDHLVALSVLQTEKPALDDWEQNDNNDKIQSVKLEEAKTPELTKPVYSTQNKQTFAAVARKVFRDENSIAGDKNLLSPSDKSISSNAPGMYPNKENDEILFMIRELRNEVDQMKREKTELQTHCNHLVKRIDELETTRNTEKL